MSIAPTFEKYLAAEHIGYNVIRHEPTASSAHTAHATHIPEDRLAKGIVLRRDGGDYLLAVLPASHHLSRSEFKNEFGVNVDLANEDEIDRLFWDCAHGAVPPVGQCYGLPSVVDDSINAQPEIYVEAGDHRTLLHLTRTQFAQLTAGAQHGRFSERVPGESVVWG